MADGRSAESHFAQAADGLRLHWCERGSAEGSTLPVVCLPGLSRTTRDFDRIAEALAQDGRRVLALDYRGRGLSEWDEDPANYSLPVECRDVLTVLGAAGVSTAVFLGTSRGGLLTMLLAAVQAGLVRGAILNDIGPVLERAGLERIRGYIGRLPSPRSWAEAGTQLRTLAGARFPALDDADWQHYAELTFREADGRFELLYDPALSRNLEALDLDDVPAIWEAFDALRTVPLMAIRGEHSDLLSIATLDAMRLRHPGMVTHTVPGQGHAPFLRDEPTVDAIRRFVAGLP